MSNIGMQSSI